MINEIELNFQNIIINKKFSEKIEENAHVNQLERSISEGR